MERNQNGYPNTRNSGMQNARNENGLGGIVGGVTQNGGCGNGGSVGGATQNGCGCGNGGCGNGGCGNGGNVGGVTNPPCQDVTGFDAFPIGYAYVPRQQFCMLYSHDKALTHGTLFEKLFLPKGVYER